VGWDDTEMSLAVKLVLAPSQRGGIGMLRLLTYGSGVQEQMFQKIEQSCIILQDGTPSLILLWLESQPSWTTVQGIWFQPTLMREWQGHVGEVWEMGHGGAYLFLGKCKLHE
jgi:hypothetical protein